MADDDFGFSDDDFDDLPANTLQHLEASALRATQHQQYHQPHQQHHARPPAPESDYGLDDDGEEVVNLDDAPHHQTQPPQHYDYGYGPGLDDGADGTLATEPNTNTTTIADTDADADADVELYHSHLYVQQPPRPSQPDPHLLLQRIKKVR